MAPSSSSSHLHGGWGIIVEHMADSWQIDSSRKAVTAHHHTHVLAAARSRCSIALEAVSSEFLLLGLHVTQR
jgi:hypothetical protein